MWAAAPPSSSWRLGSRKKSSMLRRTVASDICNVCGRHNGSAIAECRPTSALQRTGNRASHGSAAECPQRWAVTELGLYMIKKQEKDSAGTGGKPDRPLNRWSEWLQAFTA